MLVAVAEANLDILQDHRDYDQGGGGFRVPEPIFYTQYVQVQNTLTPELIQDTT